VLARKEAGDQIHRAGSVQRVQCHSRRSWARAQALTLPDSGL
jgi:hypothetical protein